MMRILLSAFLLGVLLYVAPASRAADVEVLSHAQSISDSKYHKVHVEDLKRHFHRDDKTGTFFSTHRQ